MSDLATTSEPVLTRGEFNELVINAIRDILEVRPVNLSRAKKILDALPRRSQVLSH